MIDVINVCYNMFYVSCNALFAGNIIQIGMVGIPIIALLTAVIFAIKTL